MSEGSSGCCLFIARLSKMLAKLWPQGVITPTAMEAWRLLHLNPFHFDVNMAQYCLNVKGQNLILFSVEFSAFTFLISVLIYFLKQFGATSKISELIVLHYICSPNLVILVLFFTKVNYCIILLSPAGNTVYQNDREHPLSVIFTFVMYNFCTYLYSQ